MKSIQSITSFVVFMVLVVGTSCVSSKKHKNLLAEKDALMAKYEKSKAMVDDLKGQVNVLETEKSSMKTDLANAVRDKERCDGEMMKLQKISEEKEAKIKMMKSEIKAAFNVVEDGSLSVTKKGDKIYVALSNQVLYNSGSADLKKGGREIVAKLGDIFKNNPEMDVIVEGFTDEDPIRRSRYLYKDNWDLSTARASNVIRYLIKEGVSADMLTAAGRGVSSDVTAMEGKDGKAMKRRIEFIISPDFNRIYNLAK